MTVTCAAADDDSPSSAALNAILHIRRMTPKLMLALFVPSVLFGQERAPRRPVHTFSIVAVDSATGQIGVAVQSHWFSVGGTVSWAEPGVGAVATQAYANPRYGPDGLALLRAGASAEETVEQLTAADERRATRQLGVVDAHGGGATYTGAGCMTWAGGRTGRCFAVQGNILVGEETVIALADTFEATEGKPLAQRLIDCLAAAQAAGGDRRGQQSAALLVVERDGGTTTTSGRSRNSRASTHCRTSCSARRRAPSGSRSMRRSASS
jgi:uncharacterized Ntn-hydrolase superfamily protein